ncbi:type I restriction-modification system subunit M [Streptomyces niveus]|uniref:type I restriction-modification system subunit M n=1 Tax=Streptomyces niveus TaxID=193462 RepID=UPI002E337086|nr:N-6 DNA methylase [Streptomyces niveus]
MQEIKDAVWEAADRLRGSVDAMDLPEYVGGLIFLKYVSDTFAGNRSELRARLDTEGYDEDRVEEMLEDREFSGKSAIWVPRNARWPYITARTATLHVGEVINDAMYATMLANPTLRGALPTIFGRGTADQERLAEAVALIGRVRFTSTEERPAPDVLAEAYEFLLGRFGGDSGTPRSVGRLLVGILEPYNGRVYDPACGSGGLLAQAATFMAAHQGDSGDSVVYGQEINERTWRLARMNLAVHGVVSDLGDRWGDTLAHDEHPGLNADFVMAHPPFGVSDWARNEDDPRWTYGVPPPANANFAWLQHAVSKLSERGTAGIVLANGSLSSRSPSERRIRQALVEADLVAAIVALPGQLFHSTRIAACLWVLAKDKPADHRDRILFIDAHDMGTMVSRTERVLDDEDLAKITGAYHAYRNERGFCFSAGLKAVRRHEYDLAPGRYVGATTQPRALTKDLYGVFN